MVQWQVLMHSVSEEEGIPQLSKVPTRPCTTTDFDKFYTPNENYKLIFERAKKNPESFICLNDKTEDGDSISLYGLGFGTRHQRLEVGFKPCDPIPRTEENKLQTELCLYDANNPELRKKLELEGGLTKE